MKIQISVEKNDFIDRQQLFVAILFVAKDLFELYKDWNFVLQITVYNEDEEIKSCGTTAVSGDILNTAIYLKNVKNMRSCLGGHNSLKKDILHTILHEFCHALDMLFIWRTNNHKTLEQVSDGLESELRLYYGDVKVEGSDTTYHDLSTYSPLMNKWLSCPLEVKAEQFAFRNLAYFWSVMNYKGPLAVNHDWGAPDDAGQRLLL